MYKSLTFYNKNRNKSTCASYYALLKCTYFVQLCDFWPLKTFKLSKEGWGSPFSYHTAEEGQPTQNSHIPSSHYFLGMGYEINLI